MTLCACGCGVITERVHRVGRRRVYATVACKGRARDAKRAAARAVAREISSWGKCRLQRCGSSILGSALRGRPRRYCSRACAARAYRLRLRDRRNR